MNDFEKTGQQALSGMDDMQAQIERLMETTDQYIGGPLESLISGLAKAGHTSQGATRALDRFAEHALTVFTKMLTESVFEGFVGHGKAAGADKNTAETGLAGFINDIAGGRMAGNRNSGGYGEPAPVNITVFNNTAAQAEVKERTNSQGQREIEIMIDNMVAQSLTAGAQTRSVLRSVFGIDNLLSSR